MKRPTQADVARLANVSRATVSYVLNEQKGLHIPISEQTRQRVFDAVKELEYEPDARARALRLGNTKIIGILVPDLKNPHFWQIICGIESMAHRSGYDLLISHSALNQKEEDNCIKSLSHRRIDGLILLPSFTPISQGAVAKLIQSRHPVVDIGEFDSPFDCVISNYEEGTRDIMTHLLGLGHTCIGFIYGVADKKIGYDRLIPYRNALKEAGLQSYSNLIYYCGTTIEDGYKAAKHLLCRLPRPTALIVINDLLAIGTIRAARDMEIRIPKDLSIAGFDDIPFSNYLSPRLTTVHRDTEKCGELAVELLLNRFKNPEIAKQAKRLPSYLIIRESTGPPP
ncbi:MAG: LacI family DNA-binding transcriptional regulator [Spirochaetota bacterium]